MRKFIIIITTSILILCISLSVYKGYELSNLKSKIIKKKINYTISETKKIDKEIKNKENEKEQIKSENEEKIKVLEVWEDMLEEIKENF